MVQHHSSTWSAGSSCKRPVLSVAAALVVLIVVNVLLFGELPAFDHHGGAEAEVANVRGSTVLERVSGGSTTPAALDSEQQNVELNVDEMAPTVPLPTYDIDMDNSIYPGPDDDDDRYFDAELYEASDSVVEATADVNDLLVETRQGRIRGKVAGKVGRVRAFLG